MLETGCVAKSCGEGVAVSVGKLIGKSVCVGKSIDLAGVLVGCTSTDKMRCACPVTNKLKVTNTNTKKESERSTNTRRIWLGFGLF